MHRNQFQEQFQDSQANFSEAAADPAFSKEQGKPMQLLRVLPSGKIELVQDTLSLVASCDTEVGFVSIVGKMRTGKSCLMNRILSLTGRGFRVDPSVSSCTQGIWIWSEPVFNQQANCWVFFMDTEGSQSLEKDAQNDAKIFTLSLLISSYLVYNSVGCIDERSLSDLEMVTALAQQVRADDRMSERQSEQQLYRYMPKFIWLLRDHTLKIEDQYGRKITATQYLENCLMDQHSSETSKKIKRSLLGYFKDRECVTMVRPVGDESQLQRLDSIPDHALRRQFVEVLSLLREKLIRGCRPKNFGGQEVTGPAMANMIEAFVDSFNSGSIPSIKSAWTQISEDQGAKAYNLAVTRYQQIFRQNFESDEAKADEELRQVLLKLREQTLNEFEDNLSNKRQHQNFRDDLRRLIDGKEQDIININKNVCETRNNEILIQLSQELKVKMASQSYMENRKQIQRDFQNIINQYNLQAKGPGKAQILADFVKTMNSAIFSMEETKKEDKTSSADRIRVEEQEKMLKIKEKEMESLRRQLEVKDREAREAKVKAKEKERDRPKPETQGCCSGGCTIM